MMHAETNLADIPLMTWGPTIIPCESKPNRTRRHGGWELSELTDRRKKTDRPSGWAMVPRRTRFFDGVTFPHAPKVEGACQYPGSDFELSRPIQNLDGCHLKFRIGVAGEP